MWNNQVYVLRSIRSLRTIRYAVTAPCQHHCRSCAERCRPMPRQRRPLVRPADWVGLHRAAGTLLQIGGGVDCAFMYPDPADLGTVRSNRQPQLPHSTSSAQSNGKMRWKSMC